MMKSFAIDFLFFKSCICGETFDWNIRILLISGPGLLMFIFVQLYSTRTRSIEEKLSHYITRSPESSRVLFITTTSNAAESCNFFFKSRDIHLCCVSFDRATSQWLSNQKGNYISWRNSTLAGPCSELNNPRFPSDQTAKTLRTEIFSGQFSSMYVQ